MSYIIETALELACVYSFVALALFLSFRILDIADLTTDGCFVLGMCVSIVCTLNNHPLLGILLGMVSGGLAGLVTALLQTKLGVPSILAGIITNTALYTINLMVMGFSSNISILRNKTIFNGNKLLLLVLIVVVAMILLRYFLSTRLGLSIRATGDNIDMVAASSINPKACILIGLATLIIGETLINGKKSITRNIIACLIGNIIYRLVYAFILQTHIIPIECLKLMTALIITLAIALPYLKDRKKALC